MPDIEDQDQASTYDSYAIGDIHGEVTLLKRLLASLPYQPEDHLIFLGDYVDRGEDSVAVIQTLQELQQQHEHCIFLRGNHEDAWLEAWNGTAFQEQPPIEGAHKVWEDCNGQVPAEVGQWLQQTTRIDYEDANAYYVHAGVVPGKPFWSTAPFYKMWGPKGFMERDYDWGKPVVFGHWELPEPLLKAHKIGIDTGAWRTGILTAVRLPDRKIFQVQRA